MIQMKSIADWIRNHLLNEADKSTLEGVKSCPDHELCGPVDMAWVEERATEKVDSIGIDLILQRCFDRFRMGSIRYERFLGVDRDVGHATRACSAISRYAKTKNTEDLIDAMNYILLELVHPQFEGTQYTPGDHSE